MSSSSTVLLINALVVDMLQIMSCSYNSRPNSGYTKENQGTAHYFYEMIIAEAFISNAAD